MKRTLLALSLLLSGTASAQNVPAIENITYTPGSYLPISAPPNAQPLLNYQAPRLPEEPIPANAQGHLPQGATVQGDQSIVFTYGETFPLSFVRPFTSVTYRFNPEKPFNH